LDLGRYRRQRSVIRSPGLIGLFLALGTRARPTRSPPTDGTAPGADECGRITLAVPRINRSIGRRGIGRRSRAISFGFAPRPDRSRPPTPAGGLSCPVFGSHSYKSASGALDLSLVTMAMYILLRRLLRGRFRNSVGHLPDSRAPRDGHAMRQAASASSRPPCSSALRNFSGKSFWRRS